MKFNNVENAYEVLAQYILSFVGSRSWDKGICKIGIFEKMAKGEQWLIFNGHKDEKGGFENDQTAIWNELDAAVFLRDDLLKTTGRRIWGLTFTLYPTGKFNIEYDYEKPEDYEESDELISGDEINQSLNDLFKN